MNITESDHENFAKVLAAGGDLLVDFYAPWCGPCRNMLRELETFASQNPDIAVMKVNIEEEKNREFVARFNVSTIPSLFFFRDGKLQKHLTGFFRSRVLEEKLEIKK